MPSVTITNASAAVITNVQNNITAGNSGNWLSNVRNASTGTLVVNYSPGQSSGGASTTAPYMAYDAGRSGNAGRIDRSFYYFDSFGTGVQGNITGIVFKLAYSQQGTDAFRLIKSSAGSGNLATSNFGDIDFNTLYYDSMITIAGSTSGVENITLNSNAVSDANSNGYLNIAGVVQKFDYDGSAVSVAGVSQRGRSLFGSTNFPNQLVITYNISSYGNNVAGVASANIAKVIGVATANIGKVSGVS